MICYLGRIQLWIFRVFDIIYFFNDFEEQKLNTHCWSTILFVICQYLSEMISEGYQENDKWTLVCLTLLNEIECIEIDLHMLKHFDGRSIFEFYLLKRIFLPFEIKFGMFFGKMFQEMCSLSNLFIHWYVCLLLFLFL